jgi:hypothetical protein
VLAWARTKSGGYDYLNSRNCALCQFLRETGRAAKPYATGFDWSDEALTPVAHNQIPDDLEDPLVEADGSFAALVARLEKLCPETITTPSEWTKLDAYLTESVEA